MKSQRFNELIGASCLALSAGCSPQEDAPATSPTPSIAEDRCARVRAEIERLGSNHAWGGEYYIVGYESDFTLLVAPESGFACRSLGSGVWSTGSVSAVDERLLFELDFLEGLHVSPPSEVYPVAWGNQRLLLADRDFVRFANAVNSGEKLGSALSHVLCRRNVGPVETLERAPAKCRALLFELPLELEVAEVRDERRETPTGWSFVHRVVFRGGRDRGAFVGMLLYARCPDGHEPCRDHDRLVTITSVDESRCEGDTSDRLGLQPPRAGARFSTRAPAGLPLVAETRAVRILAEIESLGPAHSWAGEYRRSNLDGVTAFRIAPEAGFALGRRDVDGIRWFDHGDVAIEDGRLVFLGAFGRLERSDSFAIAWGDRRYLLKRYEFLEFANRVNAGLAGRSESDFYSCHRAQNSLEEAPRVPEALRELLLDRPLELEVVEVRAAEPHPTAKSLDVHRLVLGSGRDCGVFNGMVLYAISPNSTHLHELHPRSVTVVEVGASSCEADDFVYRGTPPPSVGARFSTRWPGQ